MYISVWLVIRSVTKTEQNGQILIRKKEAEM